MNKELSKRIKELAIVGECLIPLQLLWIIIFLHPSMYLLLIIKTLTLIASLGMAIGCRKEKEYGIKCAYALMWIKLVVAAVILVVWIMDAILYLFGIVDIILCIALCLDLRKIEKLKSEIEKVKKEK